MGWIGGRGGTGEVGAQKQKKFTYAANSSRNEGFKGKRNAWRADEWMTFARVCTIESAKFDLLITSSPSDYVPSFRLISLILLIPLVERWTEMAAAAAS